MIFISNIDGNPFKFFVEGSNKRIYRYPDTFYFNKFKRLLILNLWHIKIANGDQISKTFNISKSNYTISEVPRFKQMMFASTWW